MVRLPRSIRCLNQMHCLQAAGTRRYDGGDERFCCRYHGGLHPSLRRRSARASSQQNPVSSDVKPEVRRRMTPSATWRPRTSNVHWRKCSRRARSAVCASGLSVPPAFIHACIPRCVLRVLRACAVAEASALSVPSPSYRSSSMCTADSRSTRTRQRWGWATPATSSGRRLRLPLSRPRLRSRRCLANLRETSQRQVGVLRWCRQVRFLPFLGELSVLTRASARGWVRSRHERARHDATAPLSGSRGGGSRITHNAQLDAIRGKTPRINVTLKPSETRFAP